MYNAIIADDDHIIVRGLQANIPWEEHGFSLIGAFTDSRTIEGFLQKHSVDLLVLDVDMPYCSGIDIAKKTRETHPQTAIIFLTAHGEFKYAREAIQCGVMEYILKPATQETITAALDRVRWRRDHETTVLQQLDKSLLILRQQFWNAVFSGTLTEQQMENQAELLDLSFEKNGYIVIHVQLNTASSNSTGGSTTVLPSVKSDAVAIANSIFCSPDFFVVEGALEQFQVVCNCNECDAVLLAKVSDMCERLIVDIARYTTIEATIGVGAFEYGKKGIYESYRQACDAIKSRSIYGTNQVYFIQDVGDEKLSEQDWEEILALKSSESIEDHLIRLRGLLADMNQSDVVLMRYLVWSALEGTLLHSKDIRQDAEMQQILFECYRKIHESSMFDDICRCALTGVASINKGLKKEIQNDGGKVVKAAIEYIEQNYMRSGLKQSDVAKRIFVSPNYLSTLFKRHVGISFNDYLMRIRIQHAKELLENNHIKIYEVAERVGFINAHYFSACFKRIVGKSPTEFYERVIGT